MNKRAYKAKLIISLRQVPPDLLLDGTGGRFAR
jgi:hypothetical protein